MTISFRMKIFITAMLAQIAAISVVILSARMYWRLYNAEAWPVIIPSLLVALIVEAMMIFLILRRDRQTWEFSKIVSAVFVSWMGGLATFIALDGIAKLLFFQTSKIAMLAALFILFALVRRLDKT